METLYSCSFYIWISAFCRHLRDWLGVDGLSARVGEQWWCFGKVSRYEPHLLQWLEAGQASPLCLCRVLVLPLPVHRVIVLLRTARWGSAQSGLTLPWPVSLCGPRDLLLCEGLLECGYTKELKRCKSLFHSPAYWWVGLLCRNCGALLRAVCFQKGSACAEKCFVFFLFQSTKKLFSVSANF